MLNLLTFKSLDIKTLGQMEARGGGRQQKEPHKEQGTKSTGSYLCPGRLCESKFPNCSVQHFPIYMGMGMGVHYKQLQDSF